MVEVWTGIGAAQYSGWSGYSVLSSVVIPGFDWADSDSVSARLQPVEPTCLGLELADSYYH